MYVYPRYRKGYVMFENRIEAGLVTRRCEAALDGWALDAEERHGVQVCGISPCEPGAAVALETRARHLVDVDRSVAALVGHEALMPLWLRLPQEGLSGMSPLDVMLAHQSGLRFVRRLLLSEQLSRGFA